MTFISDFQSDLRSGVILTQLLRGLSNGEFCPGKENDDVNDDDEDNDEEDDDGNNITADDVEKCAAKEKTATKRLDAVIAFVLRKANKNRQPEVAHGNAKTIKAEEVARGNVKTTMKLIHLIASIYKPKSVGFGGGSQAGVCEGGGGGGGGGEAGEDEKEYSRSR